MPGGLQPFSVNRENFSHLPPIATRNGSFCTFRIDGALRRFFFQCDAPDAGGRVMTALVEPQVLVARGVAQGFRRLGGARGLVHQAARAAALLILLNEIDESCLECRQVFSKMRRVWVRMVTTKSAYGDDLCGAAAGEVGEHLGLATGEAVVVGEEREDDLFAVNSLAPSISPVAEVLMDSATGEVLAGSAAALSVALTAVGAAKTDDGSETLECGFALPSPWPRQSPFSFCLLVRNRAFGVVQTIAG